MGNGKGTRGREPFANLVEAISGQPGRELLPKSLQGVLIVWAQRTGSGGGRTAGETRQGGCDREIAQIAAGVSGGCDLSDVSPMFDWHSATVNRFKIRRKIWCGGGLGGCAVGAARLAETAARGR